ncbi:MAG TPA: heme-copper oxidase subunit III [Actinomycetes bacterium]|nr:heme-copper oxidase subunit III [Actinomycetes bacterium]
MAASDVSLREEAPAPSHAGISPSLLGMVLFIASEVMFFGGLFGAYFTIRGGAPQWPPPGTPELNVPYTGVLTAILVTSSLSMQLAVYAVRRNDRRWLVRWLIVTLVLGAAFLVGQGYEYSKLIGEGMTLRSGVFGSTFYTLTGFHGAHVTGGAIFMTIVLLRSISGQFTSTRHDSVEMCSYYWHFVDVVWVGLFSTIYLLG